MKLIKMPPWIVKVCISISLIVISIGFLAPWKAAIVYLKPLPDTVLAEVQDAVNSDLDGIILYIDQAGKPPMAMSAGINNREQGDKAQPDALFKIASIRKLYIAVAITKLVKAQRISLDDSLAHHFPELVGRIENATTITLQHLVSHRSGIPNYTDNDAFWRDGAKIRLAYALDLPAKFKPDEAYDYSNTNYLLLSKLMDNLLGYSHQQFIQQEILVPLGLTDTYSDLAQAPVDRLMSGYHIGYEQDLKLEDYGSMIASAKDVAAFMRGLNTGVVFKPGEQAIYSAIYVYDHNGLLPGYQSFAKYYPEIDAVVVQFVNTTNFDDFGLESEVIFDRIGKILLSRQ